MVPKSHPRLAKLYRQYNNRYWGGRLPEVLIYYCHLSAASDSACFGQVTHDGTIFHVAIDPQFATVRCLTHWAVLHEMTHVALWDKTITHGKPFQDRMLHLAIAGAFKRIW